MIGVLALQGAFSAHRAMLAAMGHDSLEVRSVPDLDRCTGLVLPGGESTTMSMLMESRGLIEPIAKRLDDGMAALGTCAGAILLGSAIEDGRDDQICLAAVDITTVRNGYGRQLQSFQAEIEMEMEPRGPSVLATFIRAPRISRCGDGVTVRARHDGDPVWCTQDAVTVTTFHPELGQDTSVHQAFVDAWRDSRIGGARRGRGSE